MELNNKQCASCGQVNDVSEKYCWNCGSPNFDPLPDNSTSSRNNLNQSPSPYEGLLCSNGHSNPLESRFCVVCGSSLSASQAPFTPAQPPGIVPPVGEGAGAGNEYVGSHVAGPVNEGEPPSSPITPQAQSPLCKHGLPSVGQNRCQLCSTADVEETSPLGSDVIYAPPSFFKRNKLQIAIAVPIAILLSLFLIFQFLYIPVPDVTGFTRDSASAAISDAGFNPSESTEYSDTVPEGEVMWQSGPNSRAWRGSAIDYTVSLGPETADVSFSLTVYGYDYTYITDGTCYGGLTDSTDIYDGATVNLVGDSGQIASATLSTSDFFTTTCTYTATFNDVPMNQSSYGIDIGSRDIYTETKEELAGDGWSFNLKID